MREYSIGAHRGLDPVIPADVSERLAAKGVRGSFVRGAMIYRQGEPATHIHLLLSGRAKTVLTAAGGHEALLRIHLPQNILGLTALGSRSVRDATATAIEPCETSAILREGVLALMRAEPVLSEHLVRLLVDRMTDFHYRVGEMLSQPVEQRLARALLALSQPDPTAEGNSTQGEITLTHEELANLINTRRPTVSAAINRFAEAGLVRKAGRRLLVKDAQALAALFGTKP